MIAKVVQKGRDLSKSNVEFIKHTKQRQNVTKEMENGKKKVLSCHKRKRKTKVDGNDVKIETKKFISLESVIALW